MGGRSSSNQSQRTDSNQTSINNQGEYAGNTGSISIDESSHEYDQSINDSFNTDNSIEDSYNTEIGDIDNSIDNSLDDSFNTENNGDFSGITGNVSVLDGGAIEGAFDFAGEALQTANQALDNMVQAQGKAYDFASKTTDKAFSTIGAVQDSAINTIENAMSAFGDSLGTTTSDFIAAFGESNESMNKAVQTVTQGAQERQQEQLNIVAELAKNTALQGQDIVANQSGQMVKYMAIAFAVSAAALFLGRAN